ncbi:hypothetical protein GCM10011369_24430 [Neiella marina]|uniref:Tetratricopeptide repeat protein n=1 Tax=Neiella marina TaxID=508461 RepID=A0A8J2XPK2_9GAMM|nr:tetratricopeptide repeat protein [Neiella marina]GGA81581.1 hypothetical protein GCM10011369_24430 [Neiella marina]
MNRLFISLIALLSLAACSSTETQAPVVQLSQLNLPTPSHQVGQDIPSRKQIFALSREAELLLNKKFAIDRSDKDRLMSSFRRWMVKPSGFQVDYDNKTTFTAAQAFEERAGNCLSLAILTHSFAEHLGLKAYFLEPDVPFFWEMHDSFETLGDHINVYVRSPHNMDQVWGPSGFIVDFTENDLYRYAKRYELTKDDIVGSFYHNRAAESLAANDLDLAYSFSYHALRNAPQKSKSYSLIGIVLRRMGEVELAEQAYNIGMQLDAMDPVLLNNLAFFYRAENRDYEALLMSLRLDQIKLESPFVLAREAEEYFSEGSYNDALSHYNKAIRRADYIHNFYFGKARVLLALGEYEDALVALEKAQELSTTREQNARYGGKIAALNNLL